MNDDVNAMADKFDDVITDPDPAYFDAKLGCLIEQLAAVDSDDVIASKRRLPDIPVLRSSASSRDETGHDAGCAFSHQPLQPLASDQRFP